MAEIDLLTEELSFLSQEIKSLKARIGKEGNQVQHHKLHMLERLQARCERSLKRMMENAA